MSKASERLRDIEASEQLPAATRLLRLRTRISRLQQDESYWVMADGVEKLLDAAELLLELAKESADAAEALDGILVAVALLLDGVG